MGCIIDCGAVFESMGHKLYRSLRTAQTSKCCYFHIYGIGKMYGNLDMVCVPMRGVKFFLYNVFFSINFDSCTVHGKSCSKARKRY